MRSAVTTKKNGHEVKVFLMGEAVEIEYIDDSNYMSDSNRIIQ